MSTNRGMIKWAPFSAVAPGTYMVNEVLEKKNKVTMPTLSEDQIEEISHRVMESFNNKDVVWIKFFRGGKYYKKQGIIANIDRNTAKITLSDGFVVFFSQIIEIS